ncbi:C40 family peptidase [Candidatus Thiothrix sp. Deng01]|uniref:C40 family peptidase n=1 Tax=Candidatus Thiothrix phosphatis TaxID=3112415 RepID=A0ABU6CSK0_9GAMM|nr:C40 family peptidase [Candidatus Thiothrix sp. Deng01]MEB4589754.1 C40 family peptidase [Candidatus Thiothrix sp. Deng01]
MLAKQIQTLKYSIMGSAMLAMAGCSSMPRQILPFQQTATPDKSRDIQQETTKPIHKTQAAIPPAAPSTAQAASPTPTVPTEAEPPAITSLDKVAYCALRQRGKGYCWGGNSPMKGFDCSGLTQYSFRQGASIDIPRTAAAQYQAAIKVPKEKAGRGDLVFFRTRGNQVSHVGIYLGEDRFVHAPRTGKPITTTKLEGYWKRRLVGFGRIPGACQPLLPKSVV